MGKKRIGFVGLGLMGCEMAKNLLSQGLSLIGYDTDQNRVEAIVQEGAKAIDAPQGMAEQADVIILSLPNSHVVNEEIGIAEESANQL